MPRKWTVEKVEHKDPRFIEAWNALLNSWRAEVDPEDPPYPSSVDADAVLNQPAFVKTHFWAIWDEVREKILGTSTLVIIDTEDNRDMATLDLIVHHDHRRQGIGSALLAPALPVMHTTGRSRFTGETEGSIPAGEEFLQVLGGRKILETHTNQLALQELDRALLQTWLKAANPLKAEFAMGLWGNQYPEDQLEGVARLYDLVNDQPMGEIEMERWKITPDLIRELNRQRSQGSAELRTYYLREKATGNYVGYTEIAWRPEKEFLAKQGMTAVDPAYRNRGLGRWLKAAMLEKLMRERPQVRYVRTGNADSNAPMLKINQALGFKPYSSNTQWELTRDGIEAYLASRQPI